MPHMQKQPATNLFSEGSLQPLWPKRISFRSLPNWAFELKLPPRRLSRISEALERKTVYRTTTGRSDSAAPCYAELIVTDGFYQKAAMWGRSLRTSFILRQFSANDAQPTI